MKSFAISMLVLVALGCSASTEKKLDRANQIVEMVCLSEAMQDPTVITLAEKKKIPLEKVALTVCTAGAIAGELLAAKDGSTSVSADVSSAVTATAPQGGTTAVTTGT